MASQQLKNLQPKIDFQDQRQVTEPQQRLDYDSPTLENMEVVIASTRDITPIDPLQVTYQDHSDNDATRRLEQARSSLHHSKLTVDNPGEAMLGEYPTLNNSINPDGNKGLPSNIFGQQSQIQVEDEIVIPETSQRAAEPHDLQLGENGPDFDIFLAESKIEDKKIMARSTQHLTMAKSSIVMNSDIRPKSKASTKSRKSGLKNMHVIKQRTDAVLNTYLQNGIQYAKKMQRGNNNILGGSKSLAQTNAQSYNSDHHRNSSNTPK